MEPKKFARKKNNFASIEEISEATVLPPVAGQELNCDEEDNWLKRPTPHQVTGFDKKIVSVIAGIGIVIFAFAVVYGFQTPSNGTEEETKKNSKKTNATAQIAGDIEKLPASYGDYAKKNSSKPFVMPANSQVPPAISYTPQNSTSLSDYDTGIRAASEQKALADAIKSPISFGGAANNYISAGNSQASAHTQNGYQNIDEKSPVTGGTGSSQPDANGQNEKLGFTAQNHASDFYAKAELNAPASTFEIKAGTIIPGVMISGLNSDLPGTIIAQVRENVYDTVTGNYLLIPQGSRLIGTYDSKITYGEERVLVVWTRLILPDGYSLNLENMEGYDVGGYSGLHDKVDNHDGRIITGILVSGFLNAASELANRDNGNTTVVSFGGSATSGGVQSAVGVGDKLVEKALEIQPTIIIDAGSRFNVLVTKDFTLRPYGTT